MVHPLLMASLLAVPVFHLTQTAPKDPLQGFLDCPLDHTLHLYLGEYTAHSRSLPVLLQGHIL